MHTNPPAPPDAQTAPAAAPTDSQAAPGAPAAGEVYPDRPPVAARLDPAAALAYRTPLWEHTHNADNKAAGVLTLLGIMFTLLARFGAALGQTLAPDETGVALRAAAALLLSGFAAAAL